MVTGLTQGPNVVAANACNGYPSGSNSCYVLTDRGTYDYLASGTDPAGSIPSLKIVTRNDSASAPGGANELINYFHAYIINPTKPGEAVNLPAAQAWLNFLTSQPVQAQLSTYLANTSDPGGPPFVADASPVLSTPTGIPHKFKAGKPVTVTGTVTNAEPGFPVLANVPVTINEVVGSLSLPVATARTNATGKYSLRFSPPSTGKYDVTTTQISMIEDSTLSPSVRGSALAGGHGAGDGDRAQHDHQPARQRRRRTGGRGRLGRPGYRARQGHIDRVGCQRDEGPLPADGRRSPRRQ